MAVAIAGGTSASVQSGRPTGYVLPMVLMVSLYFSIGFITALNDILIPHFKLLFSLNNVHALLVQFCFFGAYFLMSLPSGKIVNRIGYKPGIIVALCTMGVGLLFFLPASFVISYNIFLFALFVVGSGLALLQVAINPYVGALGRPESAAARLNLCGGLNSLATTIAPKVGAAFIFIAAGATAAELARSLRAPYAILAAFTFLLAIVTYFVDLPELIEKSSESSIDRGSVWQFAHLRFGAIGIFAYVGAEVAIGSTLINFLGQPAVGGLSRTDAASYVSLYWGGAMVGRFIGAYALMHIRAERALAVVSTSALVLVAAAISGHGHIAMWAIVSCGLFNSVMWPCIFALSLEGLGEFTGQGSGILVTMIVGGAIIPMAQGWLADRFGYQPSFVIVLLCYVYLVYFALHGYKVRSVRA